MMIDLALTFAVLGGWFAIAGILFLILLGMLLSIDWIFKTNVGRRFCRWIFCED